MQSSLGPQPLATGIHLYSGHDRSILICQLTAVNRVDETASPRHSYGIFFGAQL